METGVRRLLAVSYCMPPMVFPRSIQVARTLMALNQMGWQITVFCGDPQSGASGDIIDNDLAQVYASSYTRVPVAQSHRVPRGIFSLKRRRVLSAGEIARVEGYCYKVSLPQNLRRWFWVLNDSADYPQTARSVVLEDGKPLGPIHSGHSDICGLGRGRFSHWGDFLYFSTSDNSDPRVNGRSYQVIYRDVLNIQQNQIQEESEVEHDLQWLYPAVKAVCKTQRQVASSAIITFAQPWVDHLVGLELKHKIGLPWLAHFSDPWVDNLYYAGVAEKTLVAWRKMEKDVVRQADAVIFTNEYARDLVMRKYPAEWKKKTWIVPHGYDPQLSVMIASGSARGQRLRLVYTGALYKERSIKSLLEALVILERTSSGHGEIELVVAGPSDDIFPQMVSQMGLNGIVTFLGRLPYIASLRVASEADVLLVIEAPNADPNPFLPSKVVDYLMFRKPILALTPLQGATADLMRELECPVVAPDDANAIADMIGSLIQSWRAGRLRVSPRYEEVTVRYDVRRTEEAFEAALSCVIEQRKPR